MSSKMRIDAARRDVAPPVGGSNDAGCVVKIVRLVFMEARIREVHTNPSFFAHELGSDVLTSTATEVPQLPSVVLCKVARATGWHPSTSYCISPVRLPGMLGISAFAALKQQFHLGANECMQQSKPVFLAPPLTGFAPSIHQGTRLEHRLAVPLMEVRLSR